MNGESSTMKWKSSNTFFTGLMLGAVIGGAMALLYAPQSGSETRRIVKEKISDMKEKTSKAVSKIKKSADSISKTEA